MNNTLWSVLETAIGDAEGRPPGIDSRNPVGGGCINQAYRLEGRHNRYFVKLNQAEALPMFVAEADGLAALAECRALQIPRPVCRGATDHQSYLVLEWLDISSPGRDGWQALGSALAKLHRIIGSGFGSMSDNYIGTTPQSNSTDQDWIGFWREQRLGMQLRLAHHNGYDGALQHQGERLLADLSKFFLSYQPKPSLLHGDLWSGNVAADSQGRPVLFDPAVYYGDRETDLAMTELFGGFDSAFYDAYQASWPLDDGYRQRRPLYQLYHVLNHLNLFGGGYLGQAERLIRQLLGSIG